MNIAYDEHKRIFKLDTENSSYIIGIVEIQVQKNE